MDDGFWIVRRLVWLVLVVWFGFVLCYNMFFFWCELLEWIEGRKREKERIERKIFFAYLGKRVFFPCRDS